MDYSYVRKLYYESIFDQKNVRENIIMISLSAIAFFLPFMLGHPQLLVGAIVNAMLIFGSVYLKGHKMLPLILLPSIGVLVAGIIFGTYTFYLLYLIPFIWIGNAIYVYTYRHFGYKKNFRNDAFGIFAGSLLKAGFLFAVTYALVFLSVIPSMFLIAMGIIQLATALLGGFAAIGINRRFSAA